MFQTSQLPAVLFVFDNAGRLSNGQIKEIYEAIQHRDREGAAGVLLARSGFLVRLAAPGLMFLKEGLAGQFNFRGIGKDESIEFPRARRANRGPRNPDARGALRGVTSFFIAIAVLLVGGDRGFRGVSLHRAGGQAIRGRDFINSRGLATAIDAERNDKRAPANCDSASRAASRASAGPDLTRGC